MQPFRGFTFAGVFLAVIVNVIAAQDSGAPRFALVIGNGSYEHVQTLRNPPNDAEDVTSDLKKLGFQVRLLVNANLTEMTNAVVQLGNQLSTSPNSVGFFYYAGHGVQNGGSNYLIPTNADIPSASFLNQMAVDMQSVLSTLQDSGNQINIIVLDACRNNPFAWSRSGVRGLSVVAAQPKGSIIMYATSAGQVAEDGTGRNGVFTGELLKHLNEPGIDIQEVFRKTGAAVQRDTNGKQVPAIYSQYFGTFHLASGASTAASVIPTLTVTQPTGSIGIAAVSAGALYLDGKLMGNVPVGSARLDSVAVGMRNLELRYPDGKSETRLVTVESDQTVAAAFTYFVQPSKSDGAPAMVLVGGGVFTMGDTAGGGRIDERPLHPVTLSSFYIARTEVTEAEFEAIMGFNPSKQKGSDLPVEQVTWYEAVTYCNELSRSGGLQEVYKISDVRKDAAGNTISAIVVMDRASNGYRLPTEAEWEYASRGGRQSHGYQYSGGNDVGAVAWYYDNAAGTPHRAGTKQPNELGIFDLSGNVWEWCWDWYGPYSSASVTNPEGALPHGDTRVVRGGSWVGVADVTRSSSRSALPPTVRSDAVGFRVVRSAE